jgi:Rha family phage regulatory protein
MVFRSIENEIVYVDNDDVFTDSMLIAKVFSRRHDNVVRLIQESIKDLEVVDYECKPTFEETYKSTDMPNSGNRKDIYYKMDRDGFMFLMMKMKGRKADYYKLRFIDAFNQMERWISDRAVGRGIRLSMTDHIRDYLPDTPHKKFRYKHFTDLVYKKIFGYGKKRLVEIHGDFDSLRDICTVDELKQIQDIENEISILLKYGDSYSGIKSKLFGVS